MSRWLQGIVRAARNARSGLAFCSQLWGRQYHDSRIILEQQGELRYLVITGRAQRIAVRSAIVFAVGACTATLVTSVMATHAFADRAALARANEAVFQALRDSNAGSGAASDERDMLSLAEQVRVRDSQIRQYVGDWTLSLANRNRNLAGLFKSSGINEKVIQIIQQNRPAGGVDEAVLDNPLLDGEFAKQTAMNEELRSVLGALPARMPLADYSISSEFGVRPNPFNGKPSLHGGVDLKPQGRDETVRAVKSGTVSFAGYQERFGNMVVVRHDRGVETVYAHMSRLFTSEGSVIKEGDALGLVGNTGHSTGKHLHFEVLVGSYQVDPDKVVKTARYVSQNN